MKVEDMKTKDLKTKDMKAFTTESTEHTEVAQSDPLWISSVLSVLSVGSVGSVVNAFGCPRARNP
jgi:hypothetical protein